MSDKHPKHTKHKAESRSRRSAFWIRVTCAPLLTACHHQFRLCATHSVVPRDSRWLFNLIKLGKFSLLNISKASFYTSARLPFEFPCFPPFASLFYSSLPIAAFFAHRHQTLFPRPIQESSIHSRNKNQQNKTFLSWLRPLFPSLLTCLFSDSPRLPVRRSSIRCPKPAKATCARPERRSTPRKCSPKTRHTHTQAQSKACPELCRTPAPKRAASQIFFARRPFRRRSNRAPPPLRSGLFSRRRPQTCATPCSAALAQSRS